MSKLTGPYKRNIPPVKLGYSVSGEQSNAENMKFKNGFAAQPASGAG
ncbi:MAG: hypothetical protein ACO1NZ_05420 [Adhaeribacter sp.]